MNNKNNSQQARWMLTRVSAAVLGIIASNAVFSAGFSLYGEGNAAAIGNYGAGLAAEAADASIGWYNPAGLVLLQDQQAVFAGVGVFPTTQMTGVATSITPNPFVPANLIYTESFTDLESAEQAFVPSFHYALPLSNNVVFGFSITSPFGLSTDWGPASPVRYAATYTELLTTDISPELGVRLSDNYSVGAGLDLQYARVKFNSVIGLPALLNADFLRQLPSLDDTLSYNKGSSYGIGFHAGLMGMFNQNHTRVGINYQSEVRHTFYGYSRFSGPLASNDLIVPVLPDGIFMSNNLYSGPLSMPAILTVSGYQDVTEKFAVLGSVVFTGWNTLKNISLNNVAAAAAGGTIGEITQAYVNVNSPQYYANTWRVAIGANYFVLPQLMFRIGGGYDQTPTNDLNRDVRLPDMDRWALAVGARYYARSNISVDAGYTRLGGIPNNGVNRADALGTSTFIVNAKTSTSVNLFGLQLNWIIDKAPETPTK